jgi:hypothetical protein
MMSHVKEYVGAEMMLLTKIVKTESIAIPFGGRNPMWMPWWLKTLGKTVHTNDILHFSYMDAVGMVENDGVLLDAETVAGLLEGLGNQNRTLENPELVRLMPQEEAAYFDQLRGRIERLSPRQRGMALRAGYNTIRYVQVMESSRFNNIKMPLGKVFAREVEELNKRVTGAGNGVAYRMDATQFVGQVQAQTLYVQFPLQNGISTEYATGARPRGPLGREVWARGASKNWIGELRQSVKGTFGDRFTSREAYFGAVSGLLERAAHLPTWVLNVEEADYPEMMRAINRHRKPKAVHRVDTREASGGYMNYFIIA